MKKSVDYINVFALMVLVTPIVINCKVVIASNPYTSDYSNCTWMAW